MLTWPGNQHLITKIKAAISAHIRPCAMIFYEQPTDAWIPFDFKLLEAYQILSDEICASCGHPTWLCRSNSNTVQFHVRSSTCYATRAMRKYEDGQKPLAEREKDKKERESWGVSYYTVPFVPDNVEGELPTRNEYFASLVQ